MNRTMYRPSRRSALTLGLGALALATAGLSACTQTGSGDKPAGSPTTPGATKDRAEGMPDEGERHTRTWMAFGATEAIWTADLLEEVQQNLADTALAIAAYEPVSMLVRSSEMRLAKDLVGSDVELVEAELDDLWVRDTGPTFVRRGDDLAGVDFNFNGWGGHQVHDLDATVARQITDEAGVDRLTTKLVLEGGALEVDGQGTALITESCVLNDNRNPGWSKQQVEAELRRLVGVRKVIWLPGIRDMDITDGHTDFYARFSEPGVVVAGLDNDPESYDYKVTRTHLAMLKEATDVAGKAVEVVTIPGPDKVRPEFASDDFASGYINFYVCNDAVIAPQFGDRKADSFAKGTLEDLFPDREVVQVAIDGIAAGGGGIHCATQQQPA